MSKVDTVSPDGRQVAKDDLPPEKTEMVICGVFDSCKCTICGRFFPDGDDICAGGHQIGGKYPLRV